MPKGRCGAFIAEAIQVSGYNSIRYQRHPIELFFKKDVVTSSLFSGLETSCLPIPEAGKASFEGAISFSDLYDKFE